MVLFSTIDEQKIRQWSADQSSSVTLQLAGGDHPASDHLRQFCDELKSIAPQVHLRRDPDDPFRSPAIIIGRHGNIAYQALPLDKELPLFLEALRRSGKPGDASTDNTVSAGQIGLPAELLLFIAPQCPHCPLSVEKFLALADANPPIRLTMIDGTLFEDMTKIHDIRSVPTLILDNQLRWTGQIDMAEVIGQCAQRDPAQLSAASLRQIIESGEAARVAAMMAENLIIFPAFIDLLIHPRWSVRLGAMVSVEYLADESPSLATRLVEPLWQRFSKLDEPIQVDIVQVLAQIGHSSARDCLEKITNGDYAASVKEAAVEELNGGNV